MLLLLALVGMGFGIGPAGRPYVFPALSTFPAMPLPPHPITIEGVALGRRLFYDPILSADGTLACASCHHQQHAFAASVRFDTGVSGVLQPRNTLPLFNLAWAGSMFWDGRAATIEEQVFHPVRNATEMNLPWTQVAQRLNGDQQYRAAFRQVFGNRLVDSTMVANVVGQFLRTLLSYRTLYDRVIQGLDTFDKDQRMGYELANDMTRGDCLHCHPIDDNPLGTTFLFSNNGLDAAPAAFADKGRGAVTGRAADNGKFKIPSLRNLAYTAPYMHDGRFATLADVIDFYSEGVKPSPTIDNKMEFVHMGGAHLSATEKRQIMAFLLTMSDTAFVTDPAHGAPQPW